MYSIISQQASKTGSIPYYFKKIEDKNEAKSYQREIKSFNPNSPFSAQRLKRLEKKAFVSGEDFLDMPIPRPNVMQSWCEFYSMYKTFLKLNGNVYIYMLTPEDGANAGEPQAYYLLPSHLIEIVVKNDVDYLMIDESPVDHYVLIEGAQFSKFPAKDVVHIKLPNANFDFNGAHLYGQSPLRAALKNIEASNSAMDQNIKTLKNSGAYGLIHGKTQPLTQGQASELKDRLKEMDDDPSRMSKIAGMSQEIGFTRLSLTADELKPFDYLNYDKKEIAACLNWVLMDNNTSDFGNTMKEIKKQRLVDDILPDLELFQEAFNDIILPKYKKYNGYMLIFDASTLPEMQMDIEILVRWNSSALLDGVINRNEYRENLGYPVIKSEEFERYTTKMGIVPLEEAFIEVEELEEEEDVIINE